jgi:hypothetical protein
MDSGKEAVPRYKSQIWKGVFPDSVARQLTTRYKLNPELIDLEDHLSEMVWRYWRRSKLPAASRVKLARQELDNAQDNEEPKTLYVAVLTQLWKTNHPSEARTRIGSALLVSVRRYHLMRGKKRGRITDLAMVSLFRTLGAIYEDGTGKPPHITKPGSSSPRGTAYQFVCDVCNILNIKVTPHYLQEVLYRRRKAAKKCTSTQPTDINTESSWFDSTYVPP